MVELLKPRNFTICLNMIVKNESNNIINTLTNLCEKIDFNYWVISDTGSTDNTKELIHDFFTKKNIKGELHLDEWVDFGHNRTIALENAYNKTDYLLIFDADDQIVGNLIFPDNIFQFDGYLVNLQLGKVGCVFKRMLLVNNKKKWRFRGVLHEYIECLENCKNGYLAGDYVVMAATSGVRSTDNNKYKKDAEILEKAYYKAFENNDIIYERYSFYCANSYRDSNNLENAIKWYKNTLTLNNWKQERYMSCLNLYHLYSKQDNTDTALYYLVKSYEYDNTRIECIYYLINHYCVLKQNEVCYAYYTLIQDYYENYYLTDDFHNKLFVSESNYSFFLPYFMIIVSERLKKYDIGLKMYNIIFQKKYIPNDWYLTHLIHNLQFFVYKNTDITFVNNMNSYFALIKNKNIHNDLINKYETYNVSKFV